MQHIHNSRPDLKILDEEFASAQRRTASSFDDIAQQFAGSLVLFGAGSLGRKIVGCLRHHGIEPLAFADSNSAKWGNNVDDVVVLPPWEAAKKFANSAAFVVAICSPGHSYCQTRKQLVSLGCPKVVSFLPLLWKYPNSLLPHYPFDAPVRILEQSEKIRAAIGLWDDEESRHQYVAHLYCRLTADFDVLPVPTLGDQYFPSDVIGLGQNEVFIDCGAFNGDTIKSFLARQGTDFKAAFAFEPDPSNFRQLSEYVSMLHLDIRHRIELFQCAVGARPGHVRFDASGGTDASIGATGSVEIECLPLDQVLHDQHPTFLKFDIEGTEQAALIGAQSLIQRERPVIAVCVYHRPEDMWKIPLYLHSLRVGYRFFLRTHSYDGLDLVLYAIPPHRIQTYKANL